MLLEEEDFQVLGDQDPDSDVEFAFVNQHWSFYVLLDDEVKSFGNWLEPIGLAKLKLPIATVLLAVVLEDLLELSVALEHVNTSPSVFICCLQYPHIGANKVTRGHSQF